MSKSSRWYDGHEIVIGFIDEQIAEVQRALNGSMEPHKRDHYEGRLEAWQSARDLLGRTVRIGREQLDRNIPAGSRSFRVTVWKDSAPMLSWEYPADDAEQAAAMAMNIVKGAGFRITKGSRRVVVNGPPVQGFIQTPHNTAKFSIIETTTEAVE